MKEVIERCNWLIKICDDEAITRDVKDDISYLLEEIERLNNIINETIKYIEDSSIWFKENPECDYILHLLKGVDKE